MQITWGWVQIDGLQEAADENRSEWEKMAESKPEDITTARRKKQMEDMSERLNLSEIKDRIKAEEEGRGMKKSLSQEGESPDYDPSYAASLGQDDIEHEMSQGMAQDEKERAINEEFSQVQAEQSMKEMPEEEQKEVIEQVGKINGKGSEEYLSAKEATGKYVRYEGTNLVINMRELEKSYNRKQICRCCSIYLKMHVPECL